MPSTEPNENFENLFRILCRTVQADIQTSDSELDITRAFYRYCIQPKKTVIHNQGSHFNYALFLGKGIVRSYCLTPDGKDITYFFFREGDFICDYESFLLRQPGNYFFETLEECECLRISYDDIQNLYRLSPAFQEFGRHLTEKAYLKVEQRLRMFMTQNLELKYRSLLDREPDLPERVPQHYLASYLGVSAEALSRLRAKEKS